jgi:phospholipid/cholesterol/gamma-HCH transport system substrate-binding protein
MDLKKFLVPGVILLLVASGAFLMFRGDDQKTLTASFPRTIAIYEGSDVKVLGVSIGRVEEVIPSGTEVKVKMSYDADVDLPSTAQALIVAPSVVGDRYVQITPPYDDGEKLADKAVLGLDRTSTPLELDQIYASIDDLTVALGPRGANREGALTQLLRTTAENFGGQGEKFHQTITDLGQLTGTLDNNREELFSTAAKLEDFLGTLAANDKTVRAFNESLAGVSELLAGEREELASSLKNLSVALTQVSTFVKDNQASLSRNIKGLNRVAKVLVRQRKALDEVLRVAPVALVNLGQTYNPQAGTLDTRANVGNVVDAITSDPGTFLCGLVSQADSSGSACNLIQQALPRAGALGGARTSRADAWDPTLGGLVAVTR